VSDLPVIDEGRCDGCGDCVSACPVQAVELVEGKARIVRPDACNFCTDCEAVCPVGAIRCEFEIVVPADPPETRGGWRSA
jgi:ferredoxin